MYKKICTACDHPNFSVFLVRVALAIPFIVHGIMKLSSLEGTVGWLVSMGVPTILAYALPFIETLGGLAVLLGVFTQVAGAVLAIVMLVAIILVHAKNGYAAQGGYEYALTLFILALGVATGKAGKFAVCKKTDAPVQ
jgi:putative oxidoreductase